METGLEKNGGILVRAPKFNWSLSKQNQGSPQKWDRRWNYLVQLHCLLQMLDSTSSRLLLAPVGAAWIWVSQDFGCWEAKPGLGTGAAGALGCSRDASSKSFGFLSAPCSGLGTGRGLLGGIRLIIPRLLTLRGGCKGAAAIPNLQAVLDPVGIKAVSGKTQPLRIPQGKHSC